MGIIGSIRKHSWIAVAVVGIAIIAFIIGDLAKNNNSVPDVAKINGTTITNQHWMALTEEAENNYKMQAGTATIATDVEYQIREQVWQSLLQETLTGEEFAKLGLTVSPAEVSDMFMGQFIHPYVRQAFTQNGTFDVKTVAQFIDNFDNLDTLQRSQWVELEKYVKNDRLQQKYNVLVASGFYTPTAIAKQIAEMGTNLSNVRVAQLPYQSVSDEECNPTEEDYKNYYNSHKADFRVSEEMRELSFIAYPINPTPTDLADIQNDVMKVWEEFQTTDDAELPAFVNYESHRKYDSSYVKASSFVAPFDSLVAAAGKGAFVAPQIVGNEWMMAKVLETAVRPDSLRISTIAILNDKAGLASVTRGDDQARQFADSVFALVKSGAISFDEAVAQYSDDPQKAETRGDSDWQLDGAFFGTLNNEIINTPVDGMFTFRFPNEIGYYVVKVTGKSTANKKYRVAVVSREIAPSDVTVRNIYNEANKFAGDNRTYQEMVAAAQVNNMQVRSAMVHSMANTLSGVNNARGIVQWAFNEKTENGTVADQIFECDNMFVVVALKDVYQKGYATLDQVRGMIENQVRLEKRAEVLLARANEAKQAGATDINSFAAKMAVAVDSVDSVSFNDFYFSRFGMEPKVLGAIAAADKGMLGPVKGANGVYMVQVDAVAKQTLPADAAAAIRSQMDQSAMQKVRGMLQYLKEKANIVDQRNKFF